MSSPWAGLPTELAGVSQSSRILKGDLPQLAAYVFHRCSAYIGEDHSSICGRLIEAALQGSVDAAAEAKAYDLCLASARPEDTLWAFISGGKVDEVAAAVSAENPQLYFEIQRLNEYGDEALEALNKAVTTITEQVRHGDEQAFVALMEAGRAYVHGRPPLLKAAG